MEYLIAASIAVMAWFALFRYLFANSSRRVERLLPRKESSHGIDLAS
jgi:hypothetical protein